MKKNLFVFLLAFFSGLVSATAQLSFLITEKDTIPIHSNPLQRYFEEKEPENDSEEVYASGWGGGRIAFYKFDGNQLAVENIYEEDYSSESPKLNSIYNETFGDVPNFKCNFYNGLLVCPYGKPLGIGHNLVRPVYSSAYEYYRLYEIKDGINVRTVDLMGDEYFKFRRDFYTYFKTTEDYSTEYKKLKQLLTEREIEMKKSFPDRYKKHKRENKYLVQKEMELRIEKQLDNIMLVVSADYIKTIAIPNKQ